MCNRSVFILSWQVFDRFDRRGSGSIDYQHFLELIGFSATHTSSQSSSSSSSLSSDEVTHLVEKVRRKLEDYAGSGWRTYIKWWNFIPNFHTYTYTYTYIYIYIHKRRGDARHIFSLVVRLYTKCTQDYVPQTHVTQAHKRKHTRKCHKFGHFVAHVRWLFMYMYICFQNVFFTYTWRCSWVQKRMHSYAALAFELKLSKSRCAYRSMCACMHDRRKLN